MSEPIPKGNPFPAADIQEGEAVLDLGSGFGVDAILAASKVGDGGRVFGIDISEKEVYAANVRAYQRNLDNIIFLPMDMEKLEFKSDVIDCVISNGVCTRVCICIICIHIPQIYMHTITITYNGSYILPI